MLWVVPIVDPRYSSNERVGYFDDVFSRRYLRHIVHTTHPYANERRGKDHLISIRKDTRGIVLYSCLPKEIYRAPRILSVLLCSIYIFFLTFTWIFWCWWWWTTWRWEHCLMLFHLKHGKPDWGCFMGWYSNFYLFFRKIVPVFFNPFSFMGIFCDLFVLYGFMYLVSLWESLYGCDLS